MSDETIAPPAPTKSAPKEPDRELYCIYRDYVAHEDDLINNRAGWFIQLHSFLIASYGIVVASVITTFFPSEHASVPAILPQLVACGLLLGITIIGASSGTALLSISAADAAIRSLRRKWEELPGTDAMTELPSMTGGGAKGIAIRGATFQLALPVAMLVLWLLSFAVPVSFAYIGRHGAALCTGTGVDRCATYVAPGDARPFRRGRP